MMQTEFGIHVESESTVCTAVLIMDDGYDNMYHEYCNV